MFICLLNFNQFLLKAQKFKKLSDIYSFKGDIAKKNFSAIAKFIKSYFLKNTTQMVYFQKITYFSAF